MVIMSALPEVPVGAVWRCTDLHLHTPAVRQFRLPAGLDVENDDDQEVLVRLYVNALATAGIEFGAITDYQGVREPWFTAIRAEAEARGITLLPGAELSLAVGKGLHLLLITDPTTSIETLNAAIRHLGKSPKNLFGDRSTEHRELDLRDSLEEALRNLRNQLPSVIVAAHANDDHKGLFKALKVSDAADLVEGGLIDAVEKCDDATRLINSAGRSSPRLNGLACVMGGDPKSIEEVGTKIIDGQPRVTWIKLSALDAGALRLALHDREVRVLRRPPQPTRHDRLLSMEVQGGFLDGLELRFSDDLTALIGGRGAGKSAVLETLRYALDISPYSEQSERDSLVSTALGSGGRVRVVLERPGPAQSQRFEVVRVYGQSPRVTDLGTGKRLAVRPQEVFGQGRAPVILLQREIAAVSRSEDYRRRLLDELIGEAALKADDTVRRFSELLRENERATESMERSLRRSQDAAERLAGLDNEIAFYDQQGVAIKLERHSKVSADGARIDTAARSTGEATERLRELSQLVLDDLGAAKAAIDGADSEHATELQRLGERVRATASLSAQSFAQLALELERLRAEIETLRSAWPDRMGALAGELRRIQAELGADRLDSQRYIDAVRERTALRPIVSAADRLTREQADLTRQREEQLTRFQEARHEAFDLRRKAARRVNKRLRDKLSLSVTYLGDTEDFSQRLTALLRGSGIGKEAVKHVVAADAVDGVELARHIRDGSAALKTRFGVTDVTADRLVTWAAADSGRLAQLELLAPADRVSIGLIVDGSPRDLSLLSGGQRATALLLLLFVQGDRTLVLDQPEDDLDNRFIFDDVVDLLRAEKGTRDPRRRRQIIVATHNANIPVNGDAELVVSLVDNGGQCEVTRRGSIDDKPIREEIRAVLEGGEEAFRRRAEKYGDAE